MIEKITIKEIFESIQGEGPYVGEKQLFVRTVKCNLNCKYCDTDFSCDENSKTYNFDELYEVIKLSDVQTVSFTGGEPLLEADFLAEFFRKYKNRLNKKIYLETNGTNANELKKVIDYVDIVSMDIKLESATGMQFSLITFEDFINIASKKEIFAKVVFDENIKNDEIMEIVALAKKYGLLIILQPKMPIDKKLNLNIIFEKFYSKYKNIRLIPQVHKFLNVR